MQDEVKLDELLNAAEKEADAVLDGNENEVGGSVADDAADEPAEGAENATEAQAEDRDGDDPQANATAEKNGPDDAASNDSPWKKREAEVAVSSGADESKLLEGDDEGTEDGDEGDEPAAPGFESLGISEATLKAVKAMEG